MGTKEDAALSSNSRHVEVALNPGDESPTPAKSFEDDVLEKDVNNPLNWSTTAKLVTYFSVCAFTFLANVNSTNFTVAVVPIMEEFNVSSTRAGYLVCFNVFLFGAGNLFWVPLMRVIGKRPVYLLSMLMLSMMNVWSTQVDSFEELLASRIISGFSASAADATVPALVSDMIPISKRGHYLMFFHLALSCGLFLGPLMNAFIIQQEDWRWMCGLLAVAVGVLFVMSVFTIRETSYLRQRDAHREITDAPRTQVQWMSVTYGYNKNASFWGSMVDILVNAAYPPILWGSITVGIYVGSIIVIQLTSSRTFPAPPYNWDLGNLGLFSLAGWIGACVAFYFGGRLIDIISSRAALKRGGQWRPENRLLAIFVPGVIGSAGVLTFGLCIAHKTHWIGPAFGFAMQSFGITAVSNVTVTYIVDSYKPIAGEALVIIFIVRNTAGMLISLYAADWIEAQSLAVVFGEMTAIQTVGVLLAIPFFVWAQSIHDWTCSFGPMKRTLKSKDSD